jgi:peptidoglycan/LPS O-acetylase OafA/YrhL
VPGSRQLPVKEAAELTRQQAGPSEHAPAVPVPESAGKDAGPKDAVAKEAGGSASRLAWLDVLRGIAALAVVFDHVSYYTLQHVRSLVYQWFDPGNYGVFVFFLISGYIVPASLERKGSVRTFWVSRVFRLYPLYLLAVGVAVAFYLVHFGKLRGEAADPVTSVLSQLLMMSNVLGGQNVPNVVWSLSYEMIFYLLLTALFIARAHKRSSWYALGFAVAAVAIGGLVSRTFLTSQVTTPRVIALVADLAVMAGLALAVARRGLPRLLGAALAAIVAVVLLIFNSAWLWPWEALSILALMFTGTMFYRAEQGQYPWRKAIAIGVTVLGLVLAAGLWHSRAWGMPAHAELLWSRRWVTAFSLAGLTFAAGLAFRRRVRWPRALTWLGLISYSVYLLHPLVIEAYHHFYPSRQHHFYLQVPIAAGLLVIVIALSSVTYLYLERPMQNVGRRVGRWLDARFGPDRVPGAVPAERRPAMAGRGRPATELPDAE